MRFQGKLRLSDYFEGWYFKQVSLRSKKTVSFIPGISLGGEDPHCFVQVIVSPPVQTHYVRYPLDAFKWTDDPFSLIVGDSRFSRQGCAVRLASEGIDLAADLKFGPFTPIEANWRMPNIMGFFAYFPKMECKHGIVSMDHTVSGEVRYNGETYSFCDDRGYIEKDWGTSFPRRYVWIQANHFARAGDSLMLSTAEIPFLGRTFTGLIANLVHGGREYRFATYTGAKPIREQRRSDGVDVEIKKGRWRLFVQARTEASGELKAPIRGLMKNTIKEGLGGSIRVRLTHGETVVCDMTSPYAGIEVV
jgi:hypothetical protein